jgi:membrane protein DedA with SNARE-associated domain
MPILALLHMHLHHIQGAPIDYAGLALAAALSWGGVPGPGEPVLIAAGVFAARHKLDIGAVLIFAWVGATTGGVAGWLLGLKAGRALVTGRGPLLQLRLKALARGEEVFERHSVLAIVLSPSWIAGIHRARAGIFLSLNAAGAVAWAAGIGLSAYFVGPGVVDFVDDVGLASAAGFAILVLVAVTAELLRRSRRRRRAAAAPNQ